MCFCSVNNITFSSLAARAASLEAVGHANNRGLKKVVGGAGGWPRRNPPRRALNVAPNGRNFIPTDCSAVSLSHGSQSKSQVALENCPLSFSILVFPPFLASPVSTLSRSRTVDRRRIFLRYHQEIATEGASLPLVSSPLSNVHPILITMRNQWTCRMLTELPLSARRAADRQRTTISKSNLPEENKLQKCWFTLQSNSG